MIAGRVQPGRGQPPLLRLTDGGLQSQPHPQLQRAGLQGEHNQIPWELLTKPGQTWTDL